MKKSILALLPIILVFIIINAIIIIFSKKLLQLSIDTNILCVANLFFFLLNVVSFFMQQKAFSHKNPNVFVRSVIAGMMLKMFTTVIAVLIYSLSSGEKFSKNAVFVSLFIYLIYLGVEVSVIYKHTKTK